MFDNTCQFNLLVIHRGNNGFACYDDLIASRILSIRRYTYVVGLPRRQILHHLKVFSAKTSIVVIVQLIPTAIIQITDGIKGFYRINGIRTACGNSKPIPHFSSGTGDATDTEFLYRNRNRRFHGIGITAP